MKQKIGFIFLFFNIIFSNFAKNKFSAEVLVIGGGTSGTMAGIQAARMGAKVIILEETAWLGGMMTSAGVSAIDGNHNIASGLWAEFRSNLEKYYGSKQALQIGWVSQVMFEPSVGQKILREMCAKEKNLLVIDNVQVSDILKVNGNWEVNFLRKNAKKQEKISAKIIIDATELGDIAAKLGVKYDLGMEAKAKYNERIAPENANDIVQDLTYVTVLKDFGANTDRTIPKPKTYNRADFICSCEKLCPDKQMPRLWDCDKMMTYGQIPNNKYMINWPINGNDFYVNMVEMSPQERLEAVKKAKEHSLNFVYFMQTELGWKNLGLAEDEFPTEDHLPMIPYHRESRRIHGLARMNMNHAEKPFDQAEPLYRTGIAVGDYPVDQHHGKNPKAPDLYYVPVPSYNVPLGSLIPESIDNLIVAEKSISVSNIMNGASRLQPVVMGIGQAAGTLAVICAKNNISPKQVSVREVQEELLKSKCFLLPYLDVQPDHPMFEVAQKIGSTGILKGTGRNYKWSNQTWFYPDSTITNGEVATALTEFLGTKINAHETVLAEKMTVMDAFEMLTKIRPQKPDYLVEVMQNYVAKKDKAITRIELADLLDKFLHPFEAKDVDFSGKFR
jgi:ribulose 1,5-bisphosphate synthetase/thiazole synthase